MVILSASWCRCGVRLSCVCVCVSQYFYSWERFSKGSHEVKLGHLVIELGQNKRRYKYINLIPSAPASLTLLFHTCRFNKLHVMNVGFKALKEK